MPHGKCSKDGGRRRRRRRENGARTAAIPAGEDSVAILYVVCTAGCRCFSVTHGQGIYNRPFISGILAVKAQSRISLRK